MTSSVLSVCLAGSDIGRMVHSPSVKQSAGASQGTHQQQQQQQQQHQSHAMAPPSARRRPAAGPNAGQHDQAALQVPAHGAAGIPHSASSLSTHILASAAQSSHSTAPTATAEGVPLPMTPAGTCWVPERQHTHAHILHGYSFCCHHLSVLQWPSNTTIRSLHRSSSRRSLNTSTFISWAKLPRRRLREFRIAPATMVTSLQYRAAWLMHVLTAL